MNSLRALSVVPPSFEELVGKAEQVLRTEVLETRCVVKGEGESRRIVTFVKVRVDKVIVGEAPAELELELLGGRVGDETLEVDGMTHFQKGERDILFVARNGKAFCPLVAVNHGRYLLVPTGAAAKEVVARADGTPLRSVVDIKVELGEPAAATSTSASTSTSTTSAELSLTTRLENETIRRTAQDPVQGTADGSSVPAGADAALLSAISRDEFEAQIAATAAEIKAAK